MTHGRLPPPQQREFTDFFGSTSPLAMALFSFILRC